MVNENDHTKKKSRRKWPWIILLGLVVIVGLVRVSLMTRPVHRWVKNLIVDTANKQLKPQLSIENLSGDLWNSATLTNVVLTEDRTVASIDTVHLEYSPLSYFSDAFQIHQVRIVRPFVRIFQQQDSTWNVQNWMAATETSAVDTSSSTFAFSVGDLSIARGRVDVSTIQIPQDSSFVIDDLQLAGRLGYFGDSYNVGIDNFSFNIDETRFDAPLTITTAARANDKMISLQKLLIATGHSMFHAAGQANLVDSTAHFKAQTKPLGWKDLAAYADSLPVKNDINLSLNVSGNINRFEANLDANAKGIDQLSLHSTIQHDSVFALTSFRVSANRLDVESFMDDTTMPSLQDLDFKAQGHVPLDTTYQQAEIKGTLTASNIQQGEYRLNKLQGTFSLQNNQAKIRIEPENGGGRLVTRATISRFWDEKPSIEASVQGSNINPENWLQDKAYAGSISFNGSISGKGWYPGQDFWNYKLTIDKSKMMGQSLNSATFSGRFNQDNLTNQSHISIGQSQLSLEARVQELQAVPQFSYSLDAQNVNIADLIGLEAYSSSFNGSITGSGQGSSVDNLQMQTQAVIDSSGFEGEAVQKIKLDAQVANSVLSIRDAMLKSSIADGSMEGSLHLKDFYDSRNKLNLNIKIKDIASFAPIAEVDVLHATGMVEGELKPVGKDSLIFDGMVDLSDINYDNQFVAKEVNGGVRVGMNQQPRYLIDFKINQPTISSVVLQNMELKTEGKLTDAVTSGSFDVSLASAREGQIVQKGTYRLTNDSVAVSLTTFDLKSSLRTLSLQKPFHTTFANSTLRTDTLYIRSKDDSASMELTVPYADSLHQKGYLKAKQLNLSAIQDAIFDDPYFSGTLQAAVKLDRTDTSMTASGNITMDNLEYENTKLDTLSLQADIKNERLKGRMELYQNKERIVEGNVDVPFKAENPNRLDKSFFEQPVSGHLTLHALSLDHFSSLLKQAGYENTSGTIQFDGSLEGQAGEPHFNARLSLKDAQLSGVPIDSLIASAKYQHENSKLNLNATLTSLKQKALEINANMPLKVDLRNFDIALPSPEDSILVDVETNDFNLKSLNDFVDRTTARNIGGRINGDVKIRGPRKNLQTKGELTLKKGAVRVVQAGIRLDHMESTVEFQPDKVVLQNFHTESGKGRLDAKGTLGLKQLVPGDINVSINAENFKAANTNEYNALVDLNMKVGGSVTTPKVSGKLQIINGFIELDNFGEKSVEQVSLDTTLSTEPNISLYDSLSLDMDVEFNKRFFVRNKRYLEMEIELDGQLDILKDSGKDLQLFGTLNTAGGYAKPLGKRFELKEGSLAFSGPVDNPQINIRTLYEPPQADQDIKIWYDIEGTVEKPKFKYESEPPMDLAGIISYTLFGQPFYKLNPAEQTVASSSGNNSVADFAMDILMDRIESLATQRLGIDVVRIENTHIGGESGTSVTTGWYINPKVFFAIQNIITGSTPTTGFYLEYYLKKNLKLILSQGNDNRQGVDVQWEHDY